MQIAAQLMIENVACLNARFASWNLSNKVNLKKNEASIAMAT